MNKLSMMTRLASSLSFPPSPRFVQGLIITGLHFYFNHVTGLQYFFPLHLYML